jgi:RNA polymerase sigma factor (sigma-70 family)
MSRHDDISDYMNEVGRHELLSHDEEQRLARLALKGDERARDELVEGNLRLVVSTAKAFVNRGLGMADLIGEGNSGLMRAVDKFDPDRQTESGSLIKFSTYATWWIRQAIRRALMERVGTIRVPSWTAKSLGEFERVARELSHVRGEMPSDDEVFDEMELEASKRQIFRHAFRATRVFSADGVAANGNGAEDVAGDYVYGEAPPEVPGKVEFGDTGVRQVLETILSARERAVLEMRFSLSEKTAHAQTLKEIARLLPSLDGKQTGVTRERVRQIEAGALSKLRLFALS